MIVAAVRESWPGEKCVAMTPQRAGMLVKAGFEVRVESGCGLAAGFSDEQYSRQGATVISDRHAVLGAAHILVQLHTAGTRHPQDSTDIAALKQGALVIGFADPYAGRAGIEALAGRGVTLLAMELLPRISRAQNMDALSAMASLAGYRAVLLAAGHLPKIFPMMVTAAGTITGARVLVIGAGVAGLQAIATARRLGAQVSGYDVRSAVKDQILSLGAKFIELPMPRADAQTAGGYAAEQSADEQARQRELMMSVVTDSDVVISTAAVPGRKSPILLTQPMVEAMAANSVIVDLAASRGGNCELTRPDEVVVHHGVTILGPTNLPATAAFHASQVYANTIGNLLAHLMKKGELVLTMDDQITRDLTVLKDGVLVNAVIKQAWGIGN